LAVHIKTPKEIDGIRQAGAIAVEVFRALAVAVEPGVSLKQLERVCDDSIRSSGAEPTFLGYRGFPSAVCLSVNEEVVHGIPDQRKLEEGDILKVDVGVTKDGCIADAARTFEVGKVSPEIHALVVAAEQAFRLGAAKARAGNRVGDIGAAVQSYAESRGYSVVRDLCGHGVGLELHEEPQVPNFVSRSKGMKLVPGMTLAIEPMINMGTYEVETLANGWTVVACDRKPSAHYENTVLVTDSEPIVLTNG